VYILETFPLKALEDSRCCLTPTRLLCTGKEPDLLESRCAVLNSAGYDTRAATPSEAEILLRTEQFDLVFVSAFLGEWEKGRIFSSRQNSRLPIARDYARLAASGCSRAAAPGR
jgi:hypothetical protein